jgi:hypothetical protein
MARALRIVLAATALISFGPVRAFAQATGCAGVADDKARLTCYDAAAKQARPTAPAGTSAATKSQSSWQVIKTRDQLSNKDSTHVESKAIAAFIQRGESVSARLIVTCSHLSKHDEAGKIGGNIWFSRPVAIGRVWGRVRIDDLPVQAINPASFSHGQIIEMFFTEGNNDPNNRMSPLFGSKRLRIEYDLPNAGKVLLEFPTSGAKDAFSKLTCADPE